MAIDYPTLFTRLGKIIKEINLQLTEQATLINYGNAIQDQYADRYDLVSGVEAQHQGFASTAQGWVSSLLNVATSTLADLQGELNAPSNSVTTILPLLARDMVENGQAVLASTVSTPTVTPDADIVGTGTLLAWTSCLLPVVAPYLVVTDERGIVETLVLVCTSDASTGSRAGGERFSLTGLPNQAAADGLDPRGSGNGPTVSVANESGLNLVPSGDMEDFASNVPNGWTLVAGAAGTQVLSSATSYTGAEALSLVGNGVATTVTLTAPVSMQPRTTYLYTVALCKSGTVTSGSNLSISDGVNTLYSADPSGLTTSYALKHLWIVTGDVAPTVLTISWAGANAAGASAVLLIDDVCLQQTASFGSVNYALVRGPVDFEYGDKIAVATSNNYAGVFQTFFGRFYGMLLPSSPTLSLVTISDSLAE